MAEGESPNGPDTGGPQPPGTDGGPDEGLIQTFLIADIRGYTRFSQEHGDEVAGRLAARFAKVTSELIDARGGAVLELRGDEALCIFSTTRRALRAAIELQARYLEETEIDPTLPLPVGVGIDTGEAVPVAGGFRGRALNLAARLCGVARAGEILATREAVHMAGSMDGIHVEDRGASSFKNIADPVGVMRITGEGADPARWFAERFPPPAPGRHASGKRRLALAALATALVAAVTIPLISTRGSASTEIQPNSIGVVDPESGEVTETIALTSRPGAVVASADTVWVTNPDIGTVTQIDPVDRNVRDSITVGRDPTEIAVGEGALWVVESGGPSVSRVSLRTHEVVDTITVGNGPAGIAIGEGSVWVTNRFDGTISRISPKPGGAVTTIPVGSDPRSIVVGFGSVWVTLAGSNTVVRIDPNTDSMTPIGVGNGPGDMAVSDDAVWVVNSLDDTVTRIDRKTNSVAATIPVGDGPSGIAIVQGTVWVANEADGTLSRIDPGQTSAQRVVIGSVPQGLADVDGELWVSVRGTSTSHRGGTLRVVSKLPPVSMDPGRAYETGAWRALHLMGDGLVAFEPVGGTTAKLVPDLATSIPNPTDGGRTYEFQVRPEIRYSNGEIVAATDFRRAIERGFWLNTYAHEDLYGGLVGGEACVTEPRDCDLSQGIEVDDVDQTITFHLREPDPEFVYTLTLPFAYPVPPSVPDRDQRRAGVPGTGPYMLEAPMSDETLALIPNPHFRVWAAAAQPEGYADRIEWTFGVGSEAQVEAIAVGDADLSFDSASSDTLDEMLVRFPAQVHTFATPGTAFFVLDTEVPPFDDVEVRRALNLALDRDRIVEIFGGERAATPTCQQLPPNFPGYEPYCPYTMHPGPEGSGSWTAPDLHEAKSIIRRSGTTGMKVVLEYPPDLWPKGHAMADYLVELLNELGYVGSATPLPFNEFYSPRNEFNMALQAWGEDYPAASNFIVKFFTCGASFTPVSGFCDPRIDAMIEHAIRIQAVDPGASGPLWAEIDRAIVDQAPFLWLINFLGVDFVSERVGNYQYNAQWGVLINQLWVR